MFLGVESKRSCKDFKLSLFVQADMAAAEKKNEKVIFVKMSNFGFSCKK